MSETTYAGAHVAEFKDATERREQTQRWQSQGHCTYPFCKCIVVTSTVEPMPRCPQKLKQEG
jgi:hypothetical protein